MRAGLGLKNLLLMFLGLLMGFSIAMAMALQGVSQLIEIILLCSIFFTLMVLIKKRRGKVMMVLGIAGITICGYLLCALLFCVSPVKTSVSEICPSERREEIALLLLSPGELSEYNYKDVLYRLNIKRKVGMDGVRWWNMPVRALQLKRNIKGTDWGYCIGTGENLYNELSKRIGDEFRLYRANLFGPPFIETSVGDILNDGYNKIIVLNNLLVEQPYKGIIDAKILDTINKSGIKAEVKFTFPLWNHDALISYYEQRIIEGARGRDPDQIGIVLVATGNDKKIRKRYPEAVKREAVFYNKIKESVMKNGYENKRIKVAYLRHRRPGIRDAADSLMEHQIDKLIVVAAGFESLDLNVQRTLPRTLEKLNLPEYMDVEFIGPWGDSEHLIDALIERLEMAWDLFED